MVNTRTWVSVAAIAWVCAAATGYLVGASENTSTAAELTPTYTNTPTWAKPTPTPATVRGTREDTHTETLNMSETADMTTPVAADQQTRNQEKGKTKPRKGKVPVTYKVDTTDPVVLITIDDGYTRPESLPQYVTETQTPITTFLTDHAGAGHHAYFTQVSQYGTVENHTVHHPDLTASDAETEICAGQHALAEYSPTMLRPPYGAYNNTVLAAAKKCNVENVVMWNVTVEDGKVSYASGNKLTRGDIILLHFNDTTTSDVKHAVKLAAAEGLNVANLRDYLP